jgi:hypothetical protein
MKQLVLTYFIQDESRAINMNLGKWGGFLLRVKFHWLRLKVLGIPGETVQEVEPVISPRIMKYSSSRRLGGSGSPGQAEKKKTC